jgi:hypothetical protein
LYSLFIGRVRKVLVRGWERLHDIGIAVQAEERMTELSKELLEVLVCPKCKTEVMQNDDRLKCMNKDCGLIYQIRDGIPVMLIEEAESPDTHPDTQT